MASDPIGVGIIGAGWWAGEHAKAIAATPGVRLVGFSSRSPERIAAFQGEYRVDGCADYHELLARPDVDVVAVAVPHDAHAAIAIEALDAGKHVLLEKPMAGDRWDCLAIARAARRSGKQLFLGLTHHFIPEVAAAKEIVARGDLGSVVAGLCGSTLPWNHARRPAFYRDRALGGGVWLTMGVHYVDRLLWLIDSEVIAVKGVLGRRFHLPDEQQADDAVTSMLHFTNGATGTIILGAYRDGGAVWNELRLVAEHGSLRLDDSGLVVSRDNGWQPVEVDSGDPMQLEWQAFARTLASDDDPPVSLAHALRVMEVLFAAEESSATGREVLLDPERSLAAMAF